jgi:hypothetical protein
MSIKVFLRVRPAIPTEISSAECLKVIGNDKVLVKRELEVERIVGTVLPDVASQGGVWDAAGQPALDAVLAGQHAVITVFGEHGSGKNHTLLGDDEGMLNNIIKELGGNAEANLAVLLFRNDEIQDLANPAADKLKVKYDKTTGAIADGATTVRLPSTAEGMAHLTKCLANRAESIEKAGSHKTLTWTVFSFGCAGGTLNVIECCGSERIFAAGLSDALNKENAARAKPLASFVQCWMESSINVDGAAIDWKAAKISRFLQPGLSAAMDTAGFASLIVCAKNTKEAAHETMCNVAFAEGSVKQEALASVSEYKEQIEYYEERLDRNEKERAALAADMKVQEAAALATKTEIGDKVDELEEQKGAIVQKSKMMAAQCAADLEKAKKDNDKAKKEYAASKQQEVERMRNLAKNAGAQAEMDIKQSVGAMEAAHAEKLTALKAELGDLKNEAEENRELLEELREMKKERGKEEHAAMKPVRDLEKEIAKLNQQLSTAGKNREDGMSEADVAANAPKWEARDALDDAEEEITKIALECMILENGIERGIGAPSDSDSSSDSDSDSDSDTSSETESEAAERAREIAQDVLSRKEEKSDKLDRASFDKELEYFKEVLKKEVFLQELVDKIVGYVEYGTNASMVTTKGFIRQFVFMGKNRKQIAMLNEVNEGVLPDKAHPVRAVNLDRISGFHLGQHSALFQSLLKQIAGRVDPPRVEDPPPPSELVMANIHRYYYRSFSIQMGKTEPWLDFICDTGTDMEAFIVSIHRMTRLDAHWGRALYIDFCENCDDLLPVERAFCEDAHLTPNMYLSAKELICNNAEILYVTLHDIRLLTGLDLYHAQRLLEVFLGQKWIIRRQLNYFVYEDKAQNSADAAMARMGTFKDPTGDVL